MDASSGAVVERYLYDPYGAATVLDADWEPVEGNQSAVDNRFPQISGGFPVGIPGDFR